MPSRSRKPAPESRKSSEPPAARRTSKSAMATRTVNTRSTGSGSTGPRGPGRAAKTPLLPPAMRDFIRKRAVEACGLTLTSVGLLLILVMLTYDRGDPSWNTAVNPEANPKIGNVLGLTGSYTADVLMQWLGAASYLVGAIIMAWGLRIMSHRGLSRVVLRIMLAIAGVLLAS